jgi:hypothetical protein
MTEVKFLVECMSFEVLTAVKMLVVWILMPRGLAGKYQCFEGTYCLYLQLCKST